MKPQIQTLMLTLLLALLLPLLGACSEAPQAENVEDTGSTIPSGRPALTLAIPGVGTSNHGTTMGHGPLTWDVPDSWVVEQPSNSMRFAQYRVEGRDGAAECVVFYFGTGQGGELMANAQRWAGQFTQPDGRNSLDLMQLRTLRDAAPATHLVELTGTYMGGMSTGIEPAPPLENAMLLGGIIEGPDAPWFFKFTGPASTVSGQRDAFIAMLQSSSFGH